MRRTKLSEIFRYKRSPNLCQTTRPSDSQQKKRTCRIVDFVVPADQRVKLKESEKQDKYLDLCDGKLTKIPKRDFYFRTCEDGAGWHLIPYIISPRSEFFSQAYKNWHIM